MSRSDARGLKSQLNLCKKRSRLPEGERKSKVRNYVRKLCPIDNCPQVRFFYHVVCLFTWRQLGGGGGGGGRV